MTKLLEVAQASRMHFIPIMILCVGLGTAAAFIWNGVFRPLLFILALVGSCTAHMFSTMYNDMWDFRTGADRAALDSPEALSTDSGYLTQNKWSFKNFEAVTWIMLAVSVGCGLLLWHFSGWWVLVLGMAGGLLAYFYVAPPIRYAYWGRGASEAAHVLSFGLLPVMGSYYVQTGHFDQRLLLLSLPLGLLTTLTFFNHHFLHWKTDRLVGKRTLVVMWGEGRSLRFSPVLLLLACLSLALCVGTGILPLYGAASLFAALPLVRMYRKMQTGRTLQAYRSLMTMSLDATLRIGALMLAAMFLQWMTRL